MMNPLFKKLNYKGQPSILCINHPDSFRQDLDSMKDHASIVTDITRAGDITFALVFATRQSEVESSISRIAPSLKGDAVVWFCYPKGTSRKYTCDFNRDTGWAVMGQFNLEPVRQVAIDEDWSALRFRKVDYIKKITRSESFALTEQAKKRTTGK